MWTHIHKDTHTYGEKKKKRVRKRRREKEEERKWPRYIGELDVVECIHVFSVFGSWKQEDHELKVIHS